MSAPPSPANPPSRGSLDDPSGGGEDGRVSGAEQAKRARAARAAVESVLVVPAPERAAIVVRGKDRLTWLNGLVTCDLAKLEAGEGAYGLLVEKKGRIKTDLFIVPERVATGPDAASDPSAAALVIAVPAALRDDVMTTLDHHLIMEDAELTAIDMTFIVAHGPRAKDLAALAPFAGNVDLLGQGGLVLGAPSCGDGGLEEQIARELGRLGGESADAQTWDAVRIERGLPRFGVEFDATLYPQEASLEKLAVSFSKGCYLGQEVVYMLENRGHVKRKLVGLTFDARARVPETGAAVATPGGEVIGEIKSAAIGAASGAPVAIAMVKWAQAKPGTELRVADDVARVRD